MQANISFVVIVLAKLLIHTMRIYILKMYFQCIHISRYYYFCMLLYMKCPIVPRDVLRTGCVPVTREEGMIDESSKKFVALVWFNCSYFVKLTAIVCTVVRQLLACVV